MKQNWCNFAKQATHTITQRIVEECFFPYTGRNVLLVCLSKSYVKRAIFARCVKFPSGFRCLSHLSQTDCRHTVLHQFSHDCMLLPYFPCNPIHSAVFSVFCCVFHQFFTHEAIKRIDIDHAHYELTRKQ